MSASPQLITRFAPSPTGALHLGNAYSALFSFLAAREGGGQFLLRVEDIDVNRCRPELVAAMLEDLAWLGLEWQEPVWYQSQRLTVYQEALDRLKAMGLIYPCFCTRKQILAEIERSGGAPHGVEGPVYPGTCRHLHPEEQAARMTAGEGHALRLDMAKALAITGPLTWQDREKGAIAADGMIFGDVVLARKDIATSYHLAVTTDDAAQGVTLVTRGMDLFEQTHIHRILQTLLGYPEPEYHHHGLIKDESGERMAKRKDSETIASLRDQGVTPQQIWQRLGFRNLNPA